MSRALSTDVLVVGLGSTAGLRVAEDELVGALRRAGATVVLERARAPREVRTLAATDLLWARAARAAAQRGLAADEPRAIVYSTVTAALLWPRPGAIRYDAPAAANRPGRHGVWQRPLERRRLARAPVLIPYSEATLVESPARRGPAVVVGLALEVPRTPPPAGAARDIAVLAYAPDARKKNLPAILAAFAAAARDGEQLVVTGRDTLGPGAPPGARAAGHLDRAAHRALLRRSRVVLNAAVREDYGTVQLEGLADGCRLVTAASPGPYAALALARALDERLVVTDPHDVDGLARALRTALDDPRPDYAQRAAVLLEPYAPAAVDRVVAEELLPALLDPSRAPARRN